MDRNDLPVSGFQVYHKRRKIQREGQQFSNQASYGGTEARKRFDIQRRVEDFHEEPNRNARIIGRTRFKPEFNREAANRTGWRSTQHLSNKIHEGQTTSRLNAKAPEPSSLLTVPSEQFMESARQRWKSLASTNQLMAKPDNRHIKIVSRYPGLYHCSVANCPTNSHTARNPQFFGFPLRSDLAHVWESKCGNKVPLDRRKAKLCRIHFARSDFYDSNNMFPKLLKPESVPSCYLNMEVKVKDCEKMGNSTEVDLRKPLLEAKNEPVVRSSRIKNRDNSVFITHDDEAIKFERNEASNKLVLNYEPVFMRNEVVASKMVKNAKNKPVLELDVGVVENDRSSRKNISEKLSTERRIPNAKKEPVLDLDVGADVKVDTKILLNNRGARNGIFKNLMTKKQDLNVKNEHKVKRTKVIDSNIKYSNMEGHENLFSARNGSELNSKEDVITQEWGFDLNSNFYSWRTRNQPNKVSAIPVPIKAEQTRPYAKVIPVLELEDLTKKFDNVRVIRLKREDDERISTKVMQNPIIAKVNPAYESDDEVVFLTEVYHNPFNSKTTTPKKRKFSAREMSRIREQPSSESDDEVVFLEEVAGNGWPTVSRIKTEIQID